MTDSFKESALKYHTHPVPGKLEIRPTKPLANKIRAGYKADNRNE